MYLSQPKIPTFKMQINKNIVDKENLIPPPKVGIVPISSTSSNMYFDKPVYKSLSKDHKIFRNDSKSKEVFIQPRSTFNSSFNTNSDISKLGNQDLKFHRYSCNIDTDRKSDQTKSLGGLYFGEDRRASDLDLEARIRELEQKMKRNQQNIKYYCEEIQHFKIQFSASTSNLLDSINTNALTGSFREPLKQMATIQSFNNKENLSKNMISIDSLAHSPRSEEMEKKLKQIDLIKKQIKGIIHRQDSMKGQFKTLQSTIRQILTGFREYLETSTKRLTKIQDKTSKKLLDKINEDINIKMKEIQSSHPEALKKMIQQMKTHDHVIRSENINTFSKSNQKFLKDPILIKIKEQVFCQVKKVNNVSPFESYEDMIKRNIYSALGKPVPYSSFSSHTSSGSQKESKGVQPRVVLEQVEITYCIDQEGYLLDPEGYYLLCDEEKIKLSEGQLQKLRHNKILQELSSFR